MLLKNWENLKDFKNVTLLHFAKFETVFWNFGQMKALLARPIFVLATSYLYKNKQTKIKALTDTHVVQESSKLLMSHCSNSPFKKWYKITISVITFLFGLQFRFRKKVLCPVESPWTFWTKKLVKMIKMNVKSPKNCFEQCDKKNLEVLSNELKVRIRGAIYGFVNVHYQSTIFAQKSHSNNEI